MGTIDITKNTSVRLSNIGSVRETVSGDFSSTSHALTGLSRAVGQIGDEVYDMALDIKKRQNAIKVNNALSEIIVGSGKISDGILSDEELSPAEYQDRFREEYDGLFNEVSKDLNAEQMEQLSMASSRLFSSSMVSLGHTAMQKTIKDERDSATRLAVSTKERAIAEPSPDNIMAYLGAFTDSESDVVRQIVQAKEEGRNDEAAELQEALRIRQRQGVDEILAEHEMNKIRAAEMSGDEAALEELSKRDWTADPNSNAEYNLVTMRKGFGSHAAKTLKDNAEIALKRVRSERFRKAHDQAMEKEIGMFRKEMPNDADGITSRLMENAAGYDELSQDQNLPVHVRKSYAQTAKNLKNAARSAKQTVTTERQNTTFEYQYANFTAGKDILTGKDLSYDEMSQIAQTLLNAQKITPMQFHKLMGFQRKALTSVQTEFRDQVFELVPKIMPNVMVRDRRFTFKPTKKVTSSEKSAGHEVDLEHGIINDTEAVFTYANFIKAMNISFAEGEKKGWGVTEMMDCFNKLTDKDQTAWRVKTVNEYLSRAEQAYQDNAANHNRVKAISEKFKTQKNAEGK